jgi:ribosomal protein S27AE
MTECRHTHLVLLPQSRKRLRCRRCHLTLTPEELGGDYCPECFETSGARHNDFEVLEWLEEARYRCEQCGALIEYRAYPINRL